MRSNKLEIPMMFRSYRPLGRMYGSISSVIDRSVGWVNKSWRNRIITYAGVMVFVVLIITAVISRAATFTATLVPNGDVTAQWTQLGGTSDSSCSGGTHCDYVDEGTTHNTADYIGTGTALRDGVIEEYSMSTVSNVSSASTVAMTVRAMSATNANGGALDSLSLNVRINGSLQTASTCTPAYNTWGTCQVTFSGSWSQSDIDSLQLQITRNRLGSGSPSNQDDDVRIANVYASITYQKAVNARQASYRVFNNTDASAPTTFIKASGDTGSEAGQAIIRTTEGGYAVTGYTASFGAGNTDMFLAKYDPSGTLSWSRTWGGGAPDSGESLVQTTDGGYVVTGTTTSFGAGNTDMFLAKYDSSGTLSWSRIWGSTSFELGNDVVQTSDGGYAVTGATYGYGAGNYDMFLVKYDSSGALSWNRTWGGTGADYGYSLIQTSDGGYAVSGQGNSFGGMFLAKYDSSGALSWSRTWGGGGAGGVNVGYSLIQTSDGGYAVSGYTQSFGVGNYDMFLVKYDSSGALSWSRTWGGTGSDQGNSLIQTSDGGYAVSGYTQSFGAGNNDMFLARYDSSGTLSWSRTWGGTGSDEGESLVQTSDGGYAVTGYTDSFGAGSTDMFLAKYNPSGTISGCSSSNCKSDTVGGGSDYTSTSQSDTVGGGSDYTSTSQSDTVGGGSDYTSSSSSPTATTGSQGASFIETLPQNTVVSVSPSGVDVGTALASQDTAATLPSTGIFRLRMNLNITSEGMPLPGDFYKLQYAKRGVDNSCDTSFTSETYADIGGSTPIRFYDNTTATQGLSMTTNANDPTDGGNTLVRQTYQEANPFTNTSTIALNNTGMWDFSLALGSGVYGGEHYCLRAVYESGTTINAYTTVAEVIVPPSVIDQASYRFFDDSEGTAQTFVKTWGSTGSEQGNSVIQTSDGGYAITGQTTSFGVSGTDMFLAKYDRSGILSWSKTWGGTGTDIGNQILQTSDGGYAITGQTTSFGAGGNDMFLAKYTSAGTLSWSKTWGGTGADSGNGFVQTSDNGYTVVGTTASFGAGGNDMFLARYNSSGTLSWSKTWGESGTESGFRIIQTSDGGYAITGSADSFDLFGSEVFLAKYDSSGSLSWSMLWGGNGIDVPSSGTEKGTGLIQTSDGGYVISGDTDSFGAGSTDAFLLRVSSSGVVSWSKTWGGTGGESPMAMVGASDGGYVIAGFTASFGAGGIDMFLNKYSSSGVLSWSKTWGGTGTDLALALNSVSDGGYVVTGYSASYGAGSNDMVLVKYSPTGTIAGCSSSNCKADTVGGGSDYTSTSKADTIGGGSDYTSTYSYDTIGGGSDYTSINKADTVGGGSDYTSTSRSDTVGGGSDYTSTSRSDTVGGGSDYTSVQTILVAAGELVTFANAYGGTSSDAIYDIMSTIDGGYVAVGFTQSYTTGVDDAFIAKYDVLGKIEWMKPRGTTAGSEIYREVVAASDGGYVTVGTMSTGSNGLDVIITKYDTSGNVSWTDTFGTTSSDYGYGIAPTGDGGYIISGQYGSTSDAFIAKYSSSGSRSWVQTLTGTSSVDIAYDVMQTSDGGYAATGTTNGYGGGGYDVFISKYNSSGTLTWMRTLGSTGEDQGYGIIQDDSDRLVVTGYVNSAGGAGLADIVVAQYDTSGNRQYSYLYGGTSNDAGYDIELAADGTYAVTGFTQSWGGGGFDFTLLNVATSGVLSWMKTFGGSGVEQSWSVAQTSDDGYVLGGYGATYTAGVNDMTVARFDSSGTLPGCGSICKSSGTDFTPTTTTSPTLTYASPSPTTASPTPSTVSATLTVLSPAPTKTNIVSPVESSPSLPAVGVGSALAAQNTAIERSGLTAHDPFRLRMNLGVTTSAVSQSGMSFKLQYLRTNASTCSGTASGYADITSSTPIRYYNFDPALDGAPITANANDPTDGSHAIIPQTYEESNNFTNSESTLQVNQDGLWDFALQIDSTSINSTYCIRAVYSTGTQINSYTNVPTIHVSPRMNQLLRQGKWFNASGIEQPFAL